MKSKTPAERKTGNVACGWGGGIRTLLGDPRKAIRRLSLPMIVAMSAQMIYNLVDAIWVSGLGADALAAIGFASPFFFAAIALSNGMGVGGGSEHCAGSHLHLHL